jgi:curved DNA-binding protein CbpA
MVKRIEDLNFYELLEVSMTATSQEIHRAYERIRRVYEPNSIALYSLFSADESAAIHQRIEEAYRTLVYEDNRKQYDAMLRRRDEMPEQEPAPPPIYQPLPIQHTLSLPSENRYISGMEPPQPPQPEPPKPVETPAPVSHFITEFSELPSKCCGNSRV